MAEAVETAPDTVTDDAVVIAPTPESEPDEMPLAEVTAIEDAPVLPSAPPIPDEIPPPVEARDPAPAARPRAPIGGMVLGLSLIHI